MKKNIFLFCLLVIISLSASSSYGKDIELDIKEYQCTEEGIRVRYGLINRKNFNVRNVGIGFKVLADNEVIKCKEIRTDVPKGADGTEVKEFILDVPCKDKSFKVRSTIFESSLSRYKVEEWFSDCP